MSKDKSGRFQPDKWARRVRRSKGTVLSLGSRSATRAADLRRRMVVVRSGSTCTG